MCEFCNIKQGDIELLVSDRVEVSIGKRKLEEHSLDIFIESDDDGEYALSSAYFVDNNDQVAEVKIPLKYCPCCGRQLTQKEITYPWNK